MRTVAFSLFLTVSLAAAAAGLAFVGGRAAADASGSYEQGVAEGERMGAARAEAAFVAGHEEYDSAFERGRREGLEQGRRQGRAEGARRAADAARDAAFGDFPGGWRAGRWYVISLAPGDGGRLGVGARVEVRGGEWYGLCATGICTRPVADRRARDRR
jgi:hypothetical protein